MYILTVKAVGGILIIAGAYGISRTFSSAFWKNVSFFEGLISGFMSLEELVCTYRIPINPALLEAAKSAGCASEIFRSAAAYNGDLQQKFSRALKDRPAVAGCIIPMAQGLISADTKLSRDAFSALKDRLLAEKARLLDEAKTMSRIYNTAGPLLGIAAVILLI